MHKFVSSILFLVLCDVALTSPASAEAPDGFKRCAACYLATGKGVPGVFPPYGAEIADALNYFVTSFVDPSGKKTLTPFSETEVAEFVARRGRMTGSAAKATRPAGAP